MPHPSGRAIGELATFVSGADANGFPAAARRTGAREATPSRRGRWLEARRDAARPGDAIVRWLDRMRTLETTLPLVGG
ncbi:MAG TPA: hypothetical protein VFS00_17800 [Polyangiaceae bacterium]|nr:hypothetical protein [Polyangiaceae bacterium]